MWYVVCRTKLYATNFLMSLSLFMIMSFRVLKIALPVSNRATSPRRYVSTVREVMPSFAATVVVSPSPFNPLSSCSDALKSSFAVVGFDCDFFVLCIVLYFVYTSFVFRNKDKSSILQKASILINICLVYFNMYG